MSGLRHGGPSYRLTTGLLCLFAAIGAAAQSRSAVVPEPPLAAGHRQMLALLEQIANETPDNHIFLGDAAARNARAKLAALPDSTPDPDRWLLRINLGQAELQMGNAADAIEHFTEARQLVTRAGD